MNNKPPVTYNPINSSMNKRKRNNNIIYIAIGVLVLVGLGIIIYSSLQSGGVLNSLIATETPTSTITPSPTNTVTPSPTFTETPTATITFTPTFSAPFTYTVQEGEYLAIIVEKFNLGDDAIPLIFLLNPYIEESGTGIDPTTQIVIPGQVILLPYPGMPLPTATPIPASFRGTIEYIVQAGDSVGGIASRFNSTIDAILKENSITDPNALFVGQTLLIPVNLVTATATRPPTSTPITPGPGTILPSATFTPINNATPTP